MTIVTPQGPLSAAAPAATAHLRLRLYIAQSTPNSLRAEQNLQAALNDMDLEPLHLDLEVVDVFSHPKRAIADGVIVTPTLIGLKAKGRITMIGDLTDAPKLRLLLQDLRDALL